MGDIKSAREIALEKIKDLGEASEEERLNWKYRPEGEQLAVRYLKDDAGLTAGVAQFPEAARPYVRRGAAEVLIRNIGLPRNDAAKNTNRKAMEGLRLLKTSKAEMENVFSRMRQLFSHYTEQGEKQRKQALQALKNEFEAKVRQEAQKQLGSMPAQIDVERLPQFQQEWRKVLAELDTQDRALLKEYRQTLAEID